MMNPEANTDAVRRLKDAFRRKQGSDRLPEDSSEPAINWGKIAALIRAGAPYRRARHLLVPPSSVFFQVRMNALMDRKLLMVPSPGMQSGFQYFDPARISSKDFVPLARLRKPGARLARDSYGAPLPHPVDLIIGEAVWAAEDGALIGDGRGHLDLICALLHTLNWIHSEGQILAVVTESQVQPSLPQEEHDVRAHWIVTPRELFHAAQSGSPSPMIHWEKLPQRQIRRNEILFHLAAGIRTNTE
jgi:5-formyltetrahydrofolate cyclo-ligase